MAHRLKQHFLVPSQWSSLEHSGLSTQGLAVGRASTRGQRPAFWTGTGERQASPHGPHPRPPHGTLVAWGAGLGGGCWGVVGLEEGVGSSEGCAPSPGAGALPMSGTMQDRPQGLWAQHLVPWGQFWSLTQAFTQDSSEEEEVLSAGQMAAIPAHGTGGQ